jgi:hypothetical protein
MHACSKGKRSRRSVANHREAHRSCTLSHRARNRSNACRCREVLIYRSVPRGRRYKEVGLIDDREEIIAELRRLAKLTKDAEREQKLLDLAQRMEAGENVGQEMDQLPLNPS